MYTRNQLKLNLLGQYPEVFPSCLKSDIAVIIPSGVLNIPVTADLSLIIILLTLWPTYLSLSTTGYKFKIDKI